MSVKVPNYEGPYGEKFDAAFNLFEKIISKFQSTLDDGFQVKDLIEWYPLVSDAYDLAKELFPEGVKKDDVTEVARYVYWAVNPNWPWIPEPIEKKVEKWLVIDLAIPLAVGAAWDAIERFRAKKGV